MSEIKIFVPAAPDGTIALEGAVVVPYASMRSAEALRYVAEYASGEFTVIYTKTLPLQMGLFAFERMMALTASTKDEVLNISTLPKSKSSLKAPFWQSIRGWRLFCPPMTL